MPWVAAGSDHGWELGLEWIDSKKPLVAVTGWATLRSLVSITADSQLDMVKLQQLLQRLGESPSVSVAADKKGKATL